MEATVATENNMGPKNTPKNISASKILKKPISGRFMRVYAMGNYRIRGASPGPPVLAGEKVVPGGRSVPPLFRQKVNEIKRLALDSTACFDLCSWHAMMFVGMEKRHEIMTKKSEGGS